jgi:ATP-dependent RNA helicase DDX46/PRP5
MKRRRSRFAPAESAPFSGGPPDPNDASAFPVQPSAERSASFLITPRVFPTQRRRRAPIRHLAGTVESLDSDGEENSLFPPLPRTPVGSGIAKSPERAIAGTAVHPSSSPLFTDHGGEEASMGAVPGAEAASAFKPTFAEPSDEIDPLDQYMKEMAATSSSVAVSEASVKKNPDADSLSDADMDDTTLKVTPEDADAVGFLDRAKRRRLVYERLDHSKIEYPPFQKDIYHEVPELARMTHEETVQTRRQLGNIRIRGKRCPKPVRSFGQCGLSSSILDAIRRAGYETPTPIQAQAIPCVMSGRDVIGVAKTGSGKTLAFLLPVLRHVSQQERPAPGEGPIALLVAPTRELATQIYGEAKRFSRVIDRRCACAYGGSGLKDQIADLKRGADIVVCTPGRMIDLLAMNSGRVTNLLRVTVVVLDEADRMFDMGFEPQLTRLTENVRPDRQTVMFSATFPPQVERLARKILKQPVEIVVGGNSIASTTIDQHVEVRSEDSKFLRLLQLLGEWYERGSTLIFVDRQDNADRIYRELSQSGYQCLSLHGGMDQADRESALVDFKNGDIKVLVATSVAARGLDVKHLNLVVNYDVPNHYEDYVHRVGRTGRAGRAGTSYTFITPEQEPHASDMAKALELSARSAIDTEGLTKDEAKALGDAAARAAVPTDLRRLAETFQVKQDAKREAGEVVRNSTSGYGGRGFTFDENDESTRKTLRMSQAKRFKAENEGVDAVDGLESDGDVDIGVDDVDIKVIDRRKVARPGNAMQAGVLASAGVSKVDTNSQGSDARHGRIEDADAKAMIIAAEGKARAEAALENLDAAQTALRITQAKAQALTTIAKRNRAANRPVDVSTDRVAAPVPATEHGDQALSAAAAAVAALSARLGKGSAVSGTGAVAGIMNSGTDPTAGGSDARDDEPRFEAELEINDYPQHARWRVTHANSLVDVTENTGCVVTARGNFYPPGRNAPTGERKLHLLIEGEDERSVKAAWKEIKLKLEEAAMARPDDKGPAYSKYSVV